MALTKAGPRTAAPEADALSHRPRAPVDRLSVHGSLLQTWLDRKSRVPPRWRTPVFARMVDLVRTHLRPITDAGVLARSYASEHFHMVYVGPPPAHILLSRDATEVAYATRWLELQSGSTRAPWAELFGDN